MDTFQSKLNKQISDYVFVFLRWLSQCSNLLDKFCYSYFCDGQGSIVRDSLEIEDVDEGSIFYANSTRLAVQVSSFLNLHLSLFSIFTNICSVAIQMIIYWYYLLG